MEIQTVSPDARCFIPLGLLGICPFIDIPCMFYLHCQDAKPNVRSDYTWSCNHYH